MIWRKIFSLIWARKTPAVVLCVMSGLLMFSQLPAFSQEPASSDEVQKKLEQVEAQVKEDPGEVETVDADISKALLKRFKAENPGAREHVLHMDSEAYRENNENPAVRLERVWIGEKATLLEIVGLPRKGNKYSAVMREDTLHLLGYRGVRRNLIAFDGVTELRDRRGGSALVLNPGETLYLLMEPVDDYHPFSLRHLNWNGNFSAYFEKIDPRFRERYDAAYKTANTPETMKDFLVEFAQNDPDKRAPQVFMKLIQLMRAQQTFEGYYNAYLLIQDPQDANMASKLARTEEHKAMIEHMAVATLTDKSRLLDFDLNLDKSSTNTREGSCWLACKYNFTAVRSVQGTLTVRANKKGAPIMLKHGNYKVNIVSALRLPRQGQRRSAWLGNFDGRDDEVVSNDFTVTLKPPHYTATIPVSLGTMRVAFFERGSAGGYSASWATGDANVSISYKSMELQK